MTNEKFGKITENLANVRLQARLTQFKNAVTEALRRLAPHAEIKFYGSTWSDDAEELLETLLNDPRKGFPRWLWDQEEEAVTLQLLDTMSVMEEALVARRPNPDTDCMPKEAEKEETDVPKTT